MFHSYSIFYFASHILPIGCCIKTNHYYGSNNIIYDSLLDRIVLGIESNNNRFDPILFGPTYTYDSYESNNI